MTIKPGIYPDFPIADYHADPCPEPSLSQSIAKVILERSPGHAMYAHPRLGKGVRGDDDEEKYSRAKAIGDAAHKLILGRGKKVVTLDYDNWRTKDSKNDRDAVISRGMTPILLKDMDEVRLMVSVFHGTMKVHEAGEFVPGQTEVAIFWQEGAFWFRSLIDSLSTDNLEVVDLKTTGKDCAPAQAGKVMADAGWDLQASFIERGLNVLHPEGAGKRRFRFISIEQDPPFGLVVNDLTEGVLTIGRQKVDRAVRMWKRCLTEKVWPTYPRVVNYPELPAWHVSQWESREMGFLCETAKSQG